MTEPEDVLTACIIWILSSCGLIISTLVGIGFYRLRKALLTSFVVLILPMVVSDNLVFIAGIVWAAPFTISQKTNTTTGFWGKRVGNFADCGWYGSLFTLILISINRFCAVAYPVKYRVWFSTRNVLIMILLGVVVPTLLLEIRGFLDHLDCGLVYYPEHYTWSYPRSPCAIAMKNMVYFHVFCMSILTFISVATVLKMRAAVTTDSKSQNDFRLAKVAVMNVLSFAICNAGFKTPYYFKLNKWGYFVNTYIVWIVCHASNGVASMWLVKPLRQEVGKIVGLNLKKVNHVLA